MHRELADRLREHAEWAAANEWETQRNSPVNPPKLRSKRRRRGEYEIY